LGAHVVSAVSVANPSLSAAAAVTVEAPPVRPPYCFSGNVKTELPTGFAPLATLPPDRPFEIVNETGTHDAVLLSHDFDGEMIEFEPEELVTFEHPMKDGTRWPPASEFYAGKPMVHFTGKVYTLRVLSSNPDDQHFRLKNGDVAHNKMAWNPIDPSAG
jgi:hypothetical protein